MNFTPSSSGGFQRKGERIDLDQLYERRTKDELKKFETYNKILDRIHKRIKTISRKKNADQYIFYNIPEFIFGVPRYDLTDCVHFVASQLQENGFVINITYPNLLFISWQHYIPEYARNAYKQQTGLQIDGFGNIVSSGTNKPVTQANNPTKKNTVSFKDTLRENMGLPTAKRVTTTAKREYKDVNTYRSSGIYDAELLKGIIKK